MEMDWGTVVLIGLGEMDWGTVVLIGLGFIGLAFIAILAVGLLFGAQKMAARNFCFTKLADGDCKFITFFDKVVFCLINYKGRIIWMPRSYQGTIDQAIASGNYNAWWAVGGLVFFGLTPIFKVFRFKMNWIERKQKGLVWEEVSHDEWVDHIKVIRVPFPFKVVEAETADGPAVNLNGDIETQIYNPFKALFGAKNWLQTTTIKLLDHLKEVVKTRTLREAVREEFDSEYLLDRISDLTDELEGTYGVKVWTMNIENVQPSLEKDAEALSSEFETDIAAENVEKLGNAEAKRLEKVTAAQKAQGLALREAYGDNAAIVKALEGKDNITTLALGAQFIPGSGGGPEKKKKRKNRNHRREERSEE